MIRATGPRRHCVVRRVHGRAIARRRARLARCWHEVPAGFRLGTLGDELGDYAVPIGACIDVAGESLIVVALPCPRHVLTKPGIA